MVFGFLRGWFAGRRRQRHEAMRVVMFTRQGCHLCEEAWQLLQAEQQRHGFRLEQTDVDQVAELAALYGDQVPVVAVDGKVRFRGRVNPVLLRRLF